MMELESILTLMMELLDYLYLHKCVCLAFLCMCVHICVLTWFILSYMIKQKQNFFLWQNFLYPSNANTTILVFLVCIVVVGIRFY